MNLDLLPSSTILVLVAVLVFVATVLLVGTGSGLFAVRQVLNRRLRYHKGPSADSYQPNDVRLDDGFLSHLSRFLTPQDSKELEALRSWLVRGGYRSPSAVRAYHLARALCTLGAAIASAATLPLIGGGLPIAALFGIVSVAILLGYLAPPFWVQRRVERRKQEAELGFPDTLDMVLVCIEAGQGLDQAIGRVATEIKDKCPMLAQELTIVGDELRAGKERPQVMRDFADRVGVNDISTFITILNQSDQYGVSIGDALRVYASEMRNKRIMKAEEQANAMPVKVALGTIFFTIPPVMLIMAGPSIVMLLRAFATMSR